MDVVAFSTDVAFTADEDAVAVVVAVVFSLYPGGAFAHKGKSRA